MLETLLRFFAVKGDRGELGESLFRTLDEGVLTGATASKLVLDGGALGKIVFRGSFDLDGSTVLGGTVESFKAIVSGEKLFKATGYDLDYDDLAAAVDAGDGEAAIQLLLSADKAVGSKGDDAIFAITPLIKAGDGDDFIVSDALDKRIKGDAGDDMIVAGPGTDVLFGGSGRDLFGFRSAGDGIDDIRDFRVGKDKIGLDTSGFAEVGDKVDADEFGIGTESATALQHIIYDDKTGALYWDADGSGGTAKVQLAELAVGLKLTAANFATDLFT